MTSFGNRIFASVISEDQVILVEGGPKSNMTGVFTSRRGDRHTHREDSHTMREADRNTSALCPGTRIHLFWGRGWASLFVKKLPRVWMGKPLN